MCTLVEVATVRFGAGNSWTELVVARANFTCDGGTFGSDPAPGVVKSCEFSDAAVPHVAQNVTVRTRPGHDKASCTNVAQKKTALMGILTMASTFRRRALIRNTYLRQKPDDFDVYFVVCTPQLVHEYALAREAAEHSDVVVMPCKENMNEGKTHTWFAYAWRNFCPYKFALKVDDDTFVHLPRLRADLVRQLHHNIYYGRRCVDGYAPMCGMLYGLSWNLVHFVATNASVRAHVNGSEDYVTYEWMQLYGAAVRFVDKSALEFNDHPSETWTGHAKPFSKHTMVVHQCKKEPLMISAYEHFFGPMNA